MSYTDTDRLWLALWLLPGLGPIRINKLVEHFQGIENIFGASVRELQRVQGIGLGKANQIAAALDTELLKIELELLERYELQVINFDNPQYPTRLREIYAPPPVLYAKGDIDLNDGLPISFVGSRKASHYGKKYCDKFIRQIANYAPDTVIVSGLALGIDTVAHKAALEAGLKTVAVLAGGLSSIYPTQNRNLAKRIQKNGILITEFPINSEPKATHFPLRNRIISGLSRGTVIVEAGKHSGATITAGYALEQNRELFALPGPLDSVCYEGTNRLIQKGQAKLIMDAMDILDELSYTPLPAGQSKEKKDKPVTSELTVEQHLIMEALGEGEMQQEALARKTGMPIHKLSANLTILEMNDLIISKPGSIYCIA